jgi:hypothetical protein
VPALKGAFVKLDADLLGGAPDIIVFQFNPDTVTRSPSLVEQEMQSPNVGDRKPRSHPFPPTESISFSLRLDATDQLAESSPIAAASGVLPALSALELLIYPKSSLASNLFSGSSGPDAYLVDTAQVPPVLFFWGVWRIVPVLITSLSITETDYDQLLNPVRAEVSVSLQVLTTQDLNSPDSIEYKAYKYTQQAKEAMAVLNLESSLDMIMNTIVTI